MSYSLVNAHVWLCLLACSDNFILGSLPRSSSSLNGGGNRGSPTKNQQANRHLLTVSGDPTVVDSGGLHFACMQAAMTSPSPVNVGAESLYEPPSPPPHLSPYPHLSTINPFPRTNNHIPILSN